LGEETTFTQIELPEEPVGFPDNPAAGNVARIYDRMANDLRDSTRTAPTFDDAVAIHRVLTAIERSAQDGDRVVLQD
jgi:predicted dehydrogenase